MNQQQKLFAIAGTSAAVVLFIGFYCFVWRKSRKLEVDDDEIEEENVDENEALQDFADLNAREAESASAAQTVVEVKVPAYMVGSIIGKGGSNIKRLKGEFGVRFDFEREEPSSEISRQEKQDRILFIRGQRDRVQEAEQNIKTMIETTPKYVEDEMLVPQSTCGRIIGKGGQTIREMQSQSGAKITLDRNEDRSTLDLRTVRLSGTTVQVEYAKLLVEEKVEQEKEFHAKGKLKQTGRQTSTNSSLFTKDFPVVKVPEDGSYFQVFVSAVDTPEHFWIQPVSKESVQLDEMTKQLTSHYSQLMKHEERLEQGRVGGICVSSFEPDTEWYRACITNVLPNATVNLYYIDFGDAKNVHVDQLKTPKADYLVLPAQAVECYMPLKPSSTSGWSDESIGEFENLTHCAQWIPLMAKIIGYKKIDGRNFPVLELVDTSDVKDINVSQMLLSKSLAVQSFESIDPLPDQEVVESLENAKKRVAVNEVVDQVDENLNLASQFNQDTFDNNGETCQNEIPTNIEIKELVKEQVVQATPIEPEYISPTVLNENHADPSAQLEQSEERLEDPKKSEFDYENDLLSIVSSPWQTEDESINSDVVESSLSKEQNTDLNIVESNYDKKSLANGDRQSSTESDDFVDIDVRTIDGAITAIVSEHVPTTPVADSVSSTNQTEHVPTTPVRDSVISPNQTDHDSPPNVLVLTPASEVLDDSKQHNSEDERTEQDNSEDERTIIFDEQMMNDVSETDDSSKDVVSELQKSLDETSRKNVLLTSMELSRQNLITTSDASLNDSFFSARSELTITDTDDTTSFLSAQERTPTNNLSFSLPDINVHTSQVDEVTPKPSPLDSRRLSGSKFEIQFIDEKTNKVLSRESLNADIESTLEEKKVGKETSV